MDILDNKNVRHIFELFSLERIPIRLTGPCVRDSLMGKIPTSISFSTTAYPDDIERLCRKYRLKFDSTNVSRGEIIVTDGQDLIISTLRSDNKPKGRWSDVEFSNSFELDAKRNTFTIDSLSIDFSGKIYDYVGGLADIEDHNLRFNGNIDEKIKEDYSVILKYFVYAAEMNLVLNPNDLSSIRNNLEGLRNIPYAEIWKNILKIFSCTNSRSILIEMYELGIFNIIGIEIDPSKIQLFHNPIMSLSSCLKMSAKELKSKFRLNSKEFKELNFFQKFRGSSMDKMILMLNSGVDKKMVINLNRINNSVDENIIEQYSPKEFPINSEDVKKGNLSIEQLDLLRNKWIQSNYTLTKEELL